MKLKIDNDALAEGFFEDAVLLGIVAPAKDYQFCWQLNQHLAMEFRINHDIEIPLTRKNRKYYFSVYEYKLPASHREHYIYNNHCDGEYLLPEFRNLDFLWLIKGEPLDPEDLSTLLQSVRKLPGVQLVTEMTHEKIRNKDHLVL